MTMEEPSITTRLTDGVLLIGFNRPQARNALTQQMYAHIAQRLNEADQAPDVRAVVLHGSSEVFTSGNDVQDFLTRTTSAHAQPQERASSQFMEAMLNFGKPLLASVNGPAIGIGATMLLHCDLVFAGTNAQLAFPFVRLGLCPEFGSSLLLSQFVGHRNAMQLLFTGAPCDAPRALVLGLVNEVLDPEISLKRTEETARQIAAHPTQALIATKRLSRAHLTDQLRIQISEERLAFESLLTLPEAKQAFERFLSRKSKSA